MKFNQRLFPLFCGVLLVACAPTIDNDSTASETMSPADNGAIAEPSKPEVVDETTDENFQGQILPITATAKILSTGKVFNLEVAVTPEQQQLGLMYRQSLPDDRGMLFEFNPPRPVSFWMKNCLMNLDMLFLRDGVIQAIAHDVPPCVTSPCPTYGTPAAIDQVIEIRGGLANEIGLKEGEKIIVTHQTN